MNILSNKAKKAIKLFDYIHSLDNEKLANELNKRQKELLKEFSSEGKSKGPQTEVLK